MGKHKGVFLQAVSELKLFLFGSALVLTVVSVVPALAQFPGGGDTGGAPVQQQPQQQMQPVAPMQQQQQQPVQQQPMEQLVPQQQNLQQQPQQPLGGQQPQMQQFGGKQQQGEQGQLPPGLSNKGKMPSGLEKQNKTPQGWEQGGKKGFEGGEFKLPSTGLKEMPKDKFPSTGKINAPSEMSGDFEDFKFDTQKPDKKGKLQFEDFEDLNFDTDLGQSKKSGKQPNLNFDFDLDLDQSKKSGKLNLPSSTFKLPQLPATPSLNDLKFDAEEDTGADFLDQVLTVFDGAFGINGKINKKSVSVKSAKKNAEKLFNKVVDFCESEELECEVLDDLESLFDKKRVNAKQWRKAFETAVADIRTEYEGEGEEFEEEEEFDLEF